MKYTIIITRKAINGMATIPKINAKKIQSKIKELSIDPRPRWAEKLKQCHAYRIAVGNYMVIFEISDESKSIYIITIDHRKCAYKNL